MSSILKLGALTALVAFNPQVQLNACANTDSDLDLIPDTSDNCVEQYNPSQLDTDTDGQGDACDDTRIEGTTLGVCYVANFEGLRGQGWTDAALYLFDDGAGTKWVILYWLPSQYPEYALQYDNGRDVWSMLTNPNAGEPTATYIEALATEIGADGTVEVLEGPVRMFECTNCGDPTNPQWSAWYEGHMTAERTDPSYCGAVE